MNFLLWPLEVRLAALFVLGAIVGGWLNLAIYRLAWHPRQLSPWTGAPEKAGPRSWRDRIPIVGWFSMAREAKLHGPGFWVRPLAIELATGLLFAGLYWWGCDQLGILPPELMQPPPAGALVTTDWFTAVHAQCASQLLLVALMIVASFIDIDEKIIPDSVTVPGTLLGLLAAVIYPWSLLPGEVWSPGGGLPLSLEFLTLSSPNRWSAIVCGWPQFVPLLIAWGCWLAWCFALLPRLWITRRGLTKAVAFFFARMRRDAVTPRIGAMAFLGFTAIATAWRFADQPRWAALLTALVGMAAAGGLVWAVRVIGFWALRREAMGFGDVTLMAMIGTFIGWQTSLVVFFLAPLAGIVIGILQWLVKRDQEIPYGPFLCLATLVVIIRWASIWEWCSLAFEVGWLVPAALVVCLALMGVLLGVWRWLKTRVLGWE